jgi:hypothetical protein
MVNVLYMSSMKKSHFLERQSTFYHSILLKMWYLYHYLPLYLSLTCDITYLSSSTTSLAIFI